MISVTRSCGWDAPSLEGGASHLELDQEFAVRITIDGGKIVRIRGFQTWLEALEAAGLRE